MGVMVKFFDDEENSELTIGPFKLIEVQGPNMVAVHDEWTIEPIAYFDSSGCWERDGLCYDRVKIFSEEPVVEE